MKNALILHGTSANSQENWFPWLKNELEQLHWSVWVPDLPQSDKPNIKRYNQFIFSNKNWESNSESIIIGHSSGAVAILGLLQELPENIAVDTCFLVAAFKDDLGWDSLKELFLTPLDFEKIKKRAKRFVFIHSDDDPYCPLAGAKYLSKQIGGEFIILKGQKHFSIGDDEHFKKLPELLELIKKYDHGRGT